MTDLYESRRDQIQQASSTAEIINEPFLGTDMSNAAFRSNYFGLAIGATLVSENAQLYHPHFEGSEDEPHRAEEEVKMPEYSTNQPADPSQ